MTEKVERESFGPFVETLQICSKGVTAVPTCALEALRRKMNYDLMMLASPFWKQLGEATPCAAKSPTHSMFCTTPLVTSP